MKGFCQAGVGTSAAQVFVTPLTSICQCPDYQPWALLPTAQAAAGSGQGAQVQDGVSLRGVWATLWALVYFPT